MAYSPETRRILEELEHRKEAKEDPCDSCDGTGISSFSTENKTLACGRCLGQGVLLNDEEHRLLMEGALTGYNEDDSILDATELH